MADISKEIQDFKDAEYGEEVRGSMISLAEKLNEEVEQNTADVAAAVEDAENAAGTANSAASGAGQAAQAAQAAANTANTAAANANAARDDILQRLEDGELRGRKATKGTPGPRGPAASWRRPRGCFPCIWIPRPEIYTRSIRTDPRRRHLNMMWKAATCIL